MNRYIQYIEQLQRARLVHHDSPDYEDIDYEAEIGKAECLAEIEEEEKHLRHNLEK
jgi:hypothetical protein